MDENGERKETDRRRFSSLSLPPPFCNASRSLRCRGRCCAVGGTSVGCHSNGMAGRGDGFAIAFEVKWLMMMVMMVGGESEGK